MLVVCTLNKQFPYADCSYTICEKTGVLTVYRGVVRVAAYAAGHWKRVTIE